MVILKIPRDAKWRRFTETEKPWREGEPPQVREFSGWLLEETPDTYHVIDLFAQDQILAKSNTKVAGRTFKQDADEMLAIRSGHDREAAGALSPRGMLTGQFQPGFVSVPEGLLSAWCLLRDDRATAAAVIFPRYSEVTDERWIKLVMRDEIGWVYHDQMLHAFTSERDYPRTIRIARHLARPIFAQYRYQDRAKELADQLQKRGEDFKSLTLPTATEWNALKATMTRPQQIDYLASRLRLLNCFQLGQPGGVSYEDEQYDKPSGAYQRNPGLVASGAKPVINPYTELLKLKLEIKDLAALAPHLGDDNYMLVFSYWRDFHPDRTLHRANWPVTELMNNTAKRDLADLRAFQTLDAAARQKQIDQILAWIKVNAGKSRSDLLLENLSAAKDFRAFEASAVELVHDKNKSAIPIFVKRAPDFGQDMGEVVALCYKLAPADVLTDARRWVRLPDQKTRFWAALILLHSGDREKLEGLPELRSILQQDQGSDYAVDAFDELLATKREEAVKLACGALNRDDHGFPDDNRSAMLQRLLLLGRQEALDYILLHLDASQVTGSSLGEFEGKRVERNQVAGDIMASELTRLRSDKYEYQTLAADNQRAAERQKLKQWISEQVQLVRAGKRSAIKTELQPFSTSRWQIDAP